MFCEHCGNEQDSGKFCSRCGMPMDFESNETTANDEPIVKDTLHTVVKKEEISNSALSNSSTSAETDSLNYHEKEIISEVNEPVSIEEAHNEIVETNDANKVIDTELPLPQDVQVENVEENNLQNSETTISLEKPDKSSRKKISILIASVLLIICICIGGYITFVAPDSFQSLMGTTTSQSEKKDNSQEPSKNADTQENIVSKQNNGKTETLTAASSYDPAKVDADQAMAAFRRHHAALSNRNYTVAYNYFSDNYKAQMGDLSIWREGFRSTRDSVVDSVNVVSQTPEQIVLNYTLHAVDYEGNGTVRRNFTGEVTMRKINNSWLIDDSNARQL